MLSRRNILLAAPTLALGIRTGRAAEAPIRFAVGPFQPTAGDTRRAYEPFFQYLGAQLG
ncbi:MAG: hypothetical protein ACRYF2_14315 [Janthinobacterium lividum]